MRDETKMPGYQYEAKRGVSYQYRGQVVLGCQEGGAVSPAIELTENVGTEGYETLDEAITSVFGPFEQRDRMGDEVVGRLRITVERL